jgi:replication factor C subunit 2/4
VFFFFIHHIAFLCQVIPEDVVKSLLAACRSGEFDVANKEVGNIIADGYPVSQLVSQVISSFYIDCHTLFILAVPLTQICLQFLDVIVSSDDIPDEQKARICKKLGETDKVRPSEIIVQ